MKRIKTFEEACTITGFDVATIPDMSALPEETAKALLAYIKLGEIQKATNGDWKADYSKVSQWKYYPWFEWVSARSAFVCTYADYTGTHADLGSRFCFPDRDTAKYIGETFTELYNDLMCVTL